MAKYYKANKSACRIVWCFALPILFFLSCDFLPDKCGGGNYYCTAITGIMPFENPVKSLYSFYNSRTLLADGKLVAQRHSYETVVYDLIAICHSDTVCDIPFASNEDYMQDTILAVLTPDRLCMVRNYSIVTLEIGNSGPDSTRLIHATYAALDSAGNFDIIDSGDSTVKVFGRDGAFVRRFRAGANPYRLIYYLNSNSLFVMDRADNSIKEFTLSGEETPRTLKTDYLSDITAFSIFHGVFLVADKGGQRLTAMALDGDVIEPKSDFCFNDISFDFGKIVSFEPGRFERETYIVDQDQNLVITFNDRLWDEAYHPRRAL